MASHPNPNPNPSHDPHPEQCDEAADIAAAEESGAAGFAEDAAKAAEEAIAVTREATRLGL